MKRMLTIVSAFALVAAISAVAAFASVTFDPSTGTGFVGKGDVQLAFGWNNKGLQDNATAVTFTYDNTESYQYTCQWFTGPNNTEHTVSHTTATGINAALDGDPRKTKGQQQFTGFILSGWVGNPNESGDPVPVVGDPCPGNQGNDSQIIAVTPLGSSGGGLYVHFNGTSVLLQ